MKIKLELPSHIYYRLLYFYPYYLTDLVCRNAAGGSKFCKSIMQISIAMQFLGQALSLLTKI